MPNFDLFVKNGMAFVRCSKTHMLCIGSLESIEGVNDDEIIQLVYRALAINAFNAIHKTGKRTIQ